MNPPAVSVIIPTYNQAHFVAEAIASAFNQTLPPQEVIVVDDGSSDSLTQALAPFEGRAGFRCLSQPNRGLPAARNTGLQASEGEFLLFLDSDDVLDPTFLAEMSTRLAAEPACGLVYCAWNQVSEQRERILRVVHPGPMPSPLPALLRRSAFFFASCALIRRSAIESVGGFNEALTWGEDADLWLRLARRGWSFAYIDRPLLQYRVHPASMTANISAGQVQGWKRVLVDFFSDPNLPQEVHALEAEAYSVMHFETAGRYLRVGMAAEAGEQVAEALRWHTPSETWLLEWAAGTALDPRTPDPRGLIRQAFDILSPSVASLHRHALGRMEAAAAFEAFQRQDLAGVRSHILPALWYDPALLGNRGFTKIALQALLKGKGPP